MFESIRVFDGTQSRVINAFSSGAVGLSLLTGRSPTITSAAQPALETRAVRVAKAAFTTPFVTPPWQTEAARPTGTARLSDVKQLRTFLDKPEPGRGLPIDVQSSFIAWKALERLRILAEAGAKPAASSERTALDAQFSKGLNELRAWLATAPSDQLRLAFGQPSTRADTIPVPVNRSLQGQGIAASRDEPLSGLAGNEVFELRLAKAGVTDLVRVDLAAGPQSPTVNSVVQAFNAGIAAIPQLAPDGTVMKDAAGNPLPKWLIRVDADKSSGQWSLVVVPALQEKIAIREPTTDTALIVATGITALDSPTAVRLLRIDDPLGEGTRATLATISATDSRATRVAALVPRKAPTSGPNPTPPDIRADTSARAMVTDEDGNSYVLGTTPGDLRASLGDGRNEIFLTKVDSLGRTIWQDSLGLAGQSDAAAMTLAPDGTILIAGSVSGRPDAPDSDMLVARYSADGRELMNTIIRSPGMQTATALAVTGDNRILLAGRQDNQNATVLQLSPDGQTIGRQELEGVSEIIGLTAQSDGSLLALGATGSQAALVKLDASLAETRRLALGTAMPSAMTAAEDGSIWVAANVRGDTGLDGAVYRVDGDLAGYRRTLLSSTGDDRLDSIAIVDDTVFVGGRTTGNLGRERIGTTDGFVARLDVQTGALGQVNQFGQPTIRTEAVRIAVAPAAGRGLAALGLASGAMQPDPADLLTGKTSLRAGDEFSIKVGDRPLQKIVIRADDTLGTLSSRIRTQTRSAVNVTIRPDSVSGGSMLRLTARQDQPVQIMAGPQGRDALAKLGLEPQQLAQPRAGSAATAGVRPGGAFGLALSTDLNLGSKEQAGVALQRIKAAIATTQSGFRSLYWNETKAKLVDAGSMGAAAAPSAYQQAQLRNYTEALNRLSGSSAAFSF